MLKKVETEFENVLEIVLEMVFEKFAGVVVHRGSNTINSLLSLMLFSRSRTHDLPADFDYGSFQ